MQSGRELFGKLPTLGTERLTLRPFALTDAPDVFAYASDPRVTAWTHWDTHESVYASAAFIGATLAGARSGAPTPWAIELTEERRVIGSCGFVSWAPADARASIGYILSPTYWKRGIVPEALGAVLTHGFSVGLNRIEAHCSLTNLASARVLQKCGFQAEGMLRQYMFVHGEPRDFNVYSLLRADWDATAWRGPAARRVVS